MSKFLFAVLMDMLEFQGGEMHNEVIACFQNGGSTSFIAS